jgi:preprotein translocase subunit Sec61beta
VTHDHGLSTPVGAFRYFEHQFIAACRYQPKTVITVGFDDGGLAIIARAFAAGE